VRLDQLGERCPIACLRPIDKCGALLSRRYADLRPGENEFRPRFAGEGSTPNRKSFASASGWWASLICTS